MNKLSQNVEDPALELEEDSQDSDQPIPAAPGIKPTPLPITDSSSSNGGSGFTWIVVLICIAWTTWIAVHETAETIRWSSFVPVLMVPAAAFFLSLFRRSEPRSFSPVSSDALRQMSCDLPEETEISARAIPPDEDPFNVIFAIFCCAALADQSISGRELRLLQSLLSEAGCLWSDDRVRGEAGRFVERVKRLGFDLVWDETIAEIALLTDAPHWKSMILEGVKKISSVDGLVDPREIRQFQRVAAALKTT